MRITTALRKFVIQLQADGRSKHTVEQYERHVLLLDRWCRQGRRPRTLSKLRHEHLAQFLVSPMTRERQDGKPKKQTSVNCLRSSLKCFFGYATTAGWIHVDPARLIRRARCSGGPPKTLSDAEQKRLLATLNRAKGFEARRDHALFMLLLRAGLRLGSALGLDVEDIDVDNRTILIRRGKGNRVEKAYLGAEVSRHLRVYLRNAKTEPAFTTAGGRRLSARQAQRRFALWLQEAGIRGRHVPHGLRHAFASNLYRKTGDLQLVQAALHHASIASTTIYARVDEQRLRKALI